MRKLIARYLIFIIGLYVLTLGVVLIIRAQLGTSPISSLTYVVSNHTPITLGMATFILNVMLILGQFWFIRDIGTKQDRFEILLQIPFSVIFSAFLDFNMYIFSGITPDSYAMSVSLLLLGCVIQALGVSIELLPNVVTMSAEGFVKYASKRYNHNFDKLKVTFDMGLVALAVITSFIWSNSIEGVREGTLIAAIAVGFFVGIINRRFSSFTLLKTIKE